MSGCFINLVEKRLVYVLFVYFRFFLGIFCFRRDRFVLVVVREMEEGERVGYLDKEVWESDFGEFFFGVRL